MEQTAFDWIEFWGYILGNMSITFLIAFAFFSNFGMLFTMITHYKVHKKNVKKKGEEFKFNFWYWLSDNFKRFLANQMAVFIFCRFSEKIQTKIERGMWLGFLVGMSIDLIIIGLRKYSIINWFQKK